MANVYMDNRWIFIGYECPLLLVHLSVTTFLGFRMRHRDSPFRAAFFIVYVLQAFARYAGYVVQLCDRFDIHDSPGDIHYVLRRTTLGFAIGFIFLGDTVIAFNRWTALVFPMKHDRVWSGKRLTLAVCLLFLGATLYGGMRTFLALIFMGTDGLDMGLGMIKAGLPHTYVSAISNLGSFVVNVFLETWTAIRYFRLNKTLQKKNTDNFRLLLYILLNEVLQINVAVYFFCNITGLQTSLLFHIANNYLAYCRYVQWFSSSVLLLLTSRTTRDGYLEFYRLRRKHADFQASTASPHSRLPNGNFLRSQVTVF